MLLQSVYVGNMKLHSGLFTVSTLSGASNLARTPSFPDLGGIGFRGPHSHQSRSPVYVGLAQGWTRCVCVGSKKEHTKLNCAPRLNSQSDHLQRDLPQDKPAVYPT
jgi:hypothetical protein